VDTSQRFTPGGQRNEHSLLFVGRLVEKKGLHHLLLALPMVVAQYPQLSLSIVGFGPEKERLLRIVQELELQDHVQFLGALPQETLPAHYRNASLFVAPFVEAENGDQEGLGLVVAEAMACACPVVVGDVPAVADLVDDQAGVRVDAKDATALANAIVSLLGDPARRTRLGDAGRRRIEAHFSWEAIAGGYGDLLSRTAMGGRL
jgi:glycosyltransferase involved in cell wall biosynthesis